MATVLFALARELTMQKNRGHRSVMGSEQSGPLVGEALAARFEARHGAAVTGAPAGIKTMVARQILRLTLGGPYRNHFLAVGQLADFREETCCAICSRQLGGRRRDVVIHGPAALEVAAAARSRAALQIVQQNAAIPLRCTGEQVLNASFVCVKSFPVDNGH